jgi:hypothetical protein
MIFLINGGKDIRRLNNIWSNMPNKNISRILTKVFIFIVLFLVSCNLAVPTVSVYDSSRKSGIKSFARIDKNKTNSFCILYDNPLTRVAHNYDVEKLGFQITDFLKSKGIIINTIHLLKSVEENKKSYNENKKFIKNIKKIENNNGYKNCDFLVLYSVWSNNYKKQQLKKIDKIELSMIATIEVFDIKINSDIFWYSFTDGGLFRYPKIPSIEDFLDKALNKWWENSREIK